MSAAVEAWLLRRWYEGVAPGPGLRALAALHGVLLRLRDAAWRRGWFRVHRLPVPVVVVGNLVAGGTGKTPLTIAIAEHLATKGWRPGVVSRGHGRRSRAPVRVAPDSSADLCGDEPLLIARRTGLPVHVDRDRVAAAQALVADGCTLIIADDGLQHRRLGRDVEIEVVDGVRRHGNGRLIPAGPLREPASRTVDLRVVNGGDARAGEWGMALEPGDARALDGGASRTLASFAPGPVHAIAGIGRPQRFFATLGAAGIAVRPHPFPDHHGYVADELEFAPPLPRLMTGKDAVKCTGFGLRDAWEVPVDARLPAGFFAALDALLVDAGAARAHA